MWKSIFALFALVALVVARSNFTEPQFSGPQLQKECRAEWRPRCGDECLQRIYDADQFVKRWAEKARARRRARRLAAWMRSWY
jgi:hypothetical protein